MDAGIRDFLNTAVGSNAFFAHLKTKVPQDYSSTYNEFSELAQDGEDFDPSMVPAEKVNQYTYIRYGNLEASAFDIAQGDGNHVGTANQVIDRMLSAMSIAQQQWPNTNLSTKPSNPIGDPAYANSDSYESATLGKTKEFSGAKFAFSPSISCSSRSTCASTTLRPLGWSSSSFGGVAKSAPTSKRSF